MICSIHKQQGILLITVVVILAIIAALALNMSTSTSSDNALIESQVDTYTLDYLVESALEHAQWQLAQNSTCGGYTDLSNKPFGNHTYSANITPTAGSPVSITATGLRQDGVSRSLIRNDVYTYQTPTTLVLQPGSEGKDSFIEGDNGHQDHNKEDDKLLKTNHKSGKEYHALLQFDLSAIPGGSRVFSAVLELNLDKSSSSSDVVGIHRLTRDWTEAGVTWTTYDGTNSWSNTGGDFDPLAAGSIDTVSTGWRSADITALTQGWVAGEFANYGLMLAPEPDKDNDVNEFTSSDDSDPNLRPKLTIVYACECGAVCAGGPGTGLIAHWKLDDAAGTTALDSVGGHHGTLVNGPTWTSGKLEGALEFDGNNDYIDAGTFDVSGSGITMLGWFNADDLTNEGRIVSKAAGIQEDEAWWQLSFITSGGSQRIRMRIKAGGTTTTFADSTVSLQPSQWYFAAATYDNVSGEMKLYLDGVEVSSRVHSTGGVLDSNPTVPVWIGANGNPTRHFDGTLDDVRIYSYALDGATIAEIAAEAGDGPIAHWRMDESGGLTAIDTEGDHNGKLIAGPTWDTEGRIGGALHFDGIDDQVQVPHDDTLSLTTALTVAAWVRNDSPSIAGSYRILSKESFGANDNFWLSLQDSSLWFGVAGNFVSPGLTMEADRWYHIAASFDDAADLVTVFVDGAEVLSQTTTGSIAPNSDPIYIGSNWEGSKHWDGLLDDVRLYDRALTQVEISALVSGGGGNGGGGGGACIATFADDFESGGYTGSTGTKRWSSDWIEFGDDGDPDSGDEIVDFFEGNWELRVRDNNDGGEGVWREADTSGSSSVSLTLSYWRYALDRESDYAALEVSANGGKDWTEIDRFMGPADDDLAFTSVTHDISKFAGSNMQVRLITSPTMGNSDEVFFDDVEICIEN